MVIRSLVTTSSSRYASSLLSDESSVSQKNISLPLKKEATKELFWSLVAKKTVSAFPLYIFMDIWMQIMT